jgi:hypothetical protein
MKCKIFYFNEFYLRKGEELFYFLMQINSQYHATFIFPSTNAKNIPEIPKQMQDKLFKMCIQNTPPMKVGCKTFVFFFSNYMKNSK